MTAFAPADIPASVDSLEKLAVWVTTALNNINLQNTVQEVSGVNQPVAVAQYFNYKVGETMKWRYVGRISVELAPEFQQGAAKLWTHAQNLSSTAIPTGFKS